MKHEKSLPTETSLFWPTRRSERWNQSIRAALRLDCQQRVTWLAVEPTNGQSACARWQRTAWAEIGQKVLTPAQLQLYLYVNRIICCECGSMTTFKLNHDTHSFSDVYMQPRCGTVMAHSQTTFFCFFRFLYFARPVLHRGAFSFSRSCVWQLVDAEH